MLFNLERSEITKNRDAPLSARGRYVSRSFSRDAPRSLASFSADVMVAADALVWFNDPSNS